MEKATLAKLSAVGSAHGAALYSIELSIIVASYIGFAEAGLFLPASNPSGTPLWPATGFALALVPCCAATGFGRDRFLLTSWPTDRSWSWALSVSVLSSLRLPGRG